MGKNTTFPVRIRMDVYRLLKQQALLFGEMQGRKVSFSDFMEELLRVSDMLLNGIESYAVNDKLYQDPAEAWGEAVREHVRTGKSVQPTIYLEVGKDQRFTLGK